MDWRPWPEGSLHEGYIAVEKDDQKNARYNGVVNSTVRRLIHAGEPIQASKIFKAEQAGFMAGLLEKDMRAVSVAVEPKYAVSGFILPGDRVDVLVVNNKFKEVFPKARKQDPDEIPKPITILNTAAETVLKNILVLAIDQTTGKVEGQAVPAKSMTLQVTAKQAEIIMAAMAMGQISLALRDIGSVQASVGTDDHTYTTDVEVSPFLASVNAARMIALEGKQAAEFEAVRKKAAEMEAAKAKEAEEEVAKAELAKKEAAKTEAATQQAVAQKTVETKPAPKKDVIKIYRGGAAETEEITIE